MSWDANPGYVGQRMSVRAMQAYEDGEMPKSKWTKKAMIVALQKWCDDNDRVYDPEIEHLLKDDMFDRFFCLSSWHHTGKFYGQTDFFSIDEYTAEIAFRQMTEEERKERDRILQEFVEAKRSEREREAENAADFYQQRYDYQKTHGFASDTVAAFMDSHPELCEVRKSKKGNEIVDCRFPGEDTVTTYELRRADRTRTYRFDAVAERRPQRQEER